MLRPVTFLAAALVASSSAAQVSSPPQWAPRPAQPPAAQPPPAAPQAQPASAPEQPAANPAEPKAVAEVKSLGKQGLRKVAPKKGPAEKLVKKHGDKLVDRAVDLAAEQAGVNPRR